MNLKVISIVLISFLYVSISQANPFETMFNGERDWKVSDIWSSNEEDWNQLRQHLSTSSKSLIVCNGANSISLQTETYNFRVELTETERLSSGQVRNQYTRHLYTNRNSSGQYTKELDRQGYHQFVFKALAQHVKSCRSGGPLASATSQLSAARSQYRKRGDRPELVREVDRLTKPFKRAGKNNQ